MPTFLVTSATGRQGASTARLLLAQGAEVNALVRDLTTPESLALQSLGARLFKGGLHDVPAITAAIQGVTGVFLNTFPGLADTTAEQRTTEICITAARAAGTVKSFVVSTVFQANYYSDWSVIQEEYPFVALYNTSKAAVEQTIRESGFTYTILRPGWLMHNFIGSATAYHFPEYPTERLLTVSTPPDFRLALFDAADVGKFASAALLDPAHFAGREIDLVNELLTFEEMAAELSIVMGVEVKVKYRTDREIAALSKTLPTVQFYHWKSENHPVVDTSKLAEFGIQLTSFKEFVGRERSGLKKTLGLEA